MYVLRRFWPVTVGDHGRDIPDQSQISRVGHNDELLLDSGLHYFEVVHQRVRGHRHTLRFLDIRCVLYIRSAVHGFRAARHRGQEPARDPGHAAGQNETSDRRDDQSMT